MGKSKLCGRKTTFSVDYDEFCKSITASFDEKIELPTLVPQSPEEVTICNSYSQRRAEYKKSSLAFKTIADSISLE